MHFKHPLSALLVLAAFVFTTVARAADLPEFTELAAKCGPAVVNINTERTANARGPEDAFNEMFRNMPPGFERFFGGPGRNFHGKQRPRKQKSLGSGFLISADGYIVTNNHVVSGADVIRVTLDEKTYKGEPVKAELIGADEETDLALLKISVKQELPFLKFGDSEGMKVGEYVMAIGNPFGLDHSVTAGILSAKGRRINAGAFDNFLQTDASINPGNSGGPLINMKGEVIGINTAIIASGQGIGFAIPSGMAKDIIAQVKTDKKVSRGWLGIGIQDLDDNMAKAMGKPDTKGSLVGNVQPDQPAAKAGIEDGDVIIALDGQDIEDSAALLRLVAQKKPGTVTTVKVWRNGQTKDMQVTLGDRGENLEASADNGRLGNGQSQKADEQLGIRVRPATKEELKQLNKVTGGLVVVEVDPESPAAEARIQRGDIILKANMKPVKTAAELSKIVKEEGVKRGAILLQVNRKGDTLFRSVPLEKKADK